MSLINIVRAPSSYQMQKQLEKINENEKFVATTTNKINNEYIDYTIVGLIIICMILIALKIFIRKIKSVE